MPLATMRERAGQVSLINAVPIAHSLPTPHAAKNRKIASAHQVGESAQTAVKIEYTKIERARARARPM